MIIREIQKTDNPEIAKVIRKVLVELEVPKVGTAYADPQLDEMFETYQQEKSIYFVIESDGKIIGGAGISGLQNEKDTCELQKMYFLSQARGIGLGSKLITKCLEKAKVFGYKSCYLETMPNMLAAQKLYKKTGFEYLTSAKGNTGHTSCPIWMIKTIS